MPRLGQVSRAVVLVEEVQHFGTGSWLCTATFGMDAGRPDLAGRLAGIAAMPAVTSVLCGRADPGLAGMKAATTEGRQTESRPAGLSRCLMVEASRPEAIDRARDHLRRSLRHLHPEVHRFQLAYSLEAEG